MTIRSIKYNDQPVFYKVQGTGNPVMLIHGFGEDACIWEELTVVLEKNHQLIIVDLPGTGMSSEALGLCNIPDCALIIAQIVEAESIRRFALLGHSMGGYIALEYAAENQHTLTGLGLLHSTAIADSDTKKEARLKNIAFLKQHDASVFLKQTTPNLFAADFVSDNKDFIEKYIATIDYINKAALISYTESMMQRKDYLSFLRSIDLPLLFVIGKYDQAVPFELSLQQCHVPKKAYIHILKKAGHMGMFEAKDEFNEIVKNYLDEVIV